MSYAGAGSAWAQRDIGPTLRRFFGAFYNGHLKEDTILNLFKHLFYLCSLFIYHSSGFTFNFVVLCFTVFIFF
jgi:hypothetical protein